MVTVGTCIFVKLLVFLWYLFQSFLVLDPTVLQIELCGGGREEGGKREGRKERGKRERKREGEGGGVGGMRKRREKGKGRKGREEGGGRRVQQMNSWQ